MKELLIRLYNEKAYTHNYIFGFIFHGMVYLVTFDKLPSNLVKLDKASRGQGYSIRFKPTVIQKMEMISMGAEILCSKEYFMEIFTNCKYNKGDVFEMLVANKHGKDWKKNTDKLLPMISKLDKASRGAGYTLRFKPDRQQKLLLMAQGARTLCSKEFFEDLAKDSKYNKGEIFEKLITEMNGQEWTKDREPFWKDGDLTIDGKAFQIKFEKATFTNEKTLARLTA